MMFLGHIAFSTAVVTLVLGFALLGWSRKEGAPGILKVGGTVILILAISNMLCIGYYMFRYWEEGYYKAPTVVTPMHQGGMGMMPMGGGARGGMMDCPMMQEKEMMMRQGMEKKSPGMPEKPPSEGGAPSESHEEHHP